MTDTVLVVELPVASLSVEGEGLPAALVATQQEVQVTTTESQGPAGPPGKDGDAVARSVINISEPTDLWVLPHDLNRYPSVTLVDSAGDVFDGDVKYVSSNVITVSLIAPFSGTAYLN